MNLNCSINAISINHKYSFTNKYLSHFTKIKNQTKFHLNPKHPQVILPSQHIFIYFPELFKISCLTKSTTQDFCFF